MLTDQQIIEGNKLIALFMGYKEEEIQAEEWCGCNVLDEVFSGHKEMLPANYHENWSRLMPVVDKTTKLAEELNEHVKITYELWMFLSNDIAHVYQSAIDFITWYNQN